MVKHKVGTIEGLVSLRHLETGKTAWQEKSTDFLDHPEMQGLRAVQRIHNLLIRQLITTQAIVEAERNSKKGTTYP